MKLIPVRCDIDHLKIRIISQWLYENVGLMAPDKELVNEFAPWFAHHYVQAPSVYYFRSEQAAIMFTLKWAK